MGYFERKKPTLEVLKSQFLEMTLQKNSFVSAVTSILQDGSTDEKDKKKRLNREIFRLCPFSKTEGKDKIRSKPLPALSRRDEILCRIKTEQVLVIEGATGLKKIPIIKYHFIFPYNFFASQTRLWKVHTDSTVSL